MGHINARLLKQIEDHDGGTLFKDQATAELVAVLMANDIRRLRLDLATARQALGESVESTTRLQRLVLGEHKMATEGMRDATARLTALRKYLLRKCKGCGHAIVQHHDRKLGCAEHIRKKNKKTKKRCSCMNYCSDPCLTG